MRVKGGGYCVGQRQPRRLNRTIGNAGREPWRLRVMREQVLASHVEAPTVTMGSHKLFVECHLP